VWVAHRKEESLPSQLLEIVAEGRRRAQRCVDRIRRTPRLRVRTLEWILPLCGGVANGGVIESYCADRRRDDVVALANRLVCGEGALALAALLEGDGVSTLLRGRVDLLHAGELCAPLPHDGSYWADATTPVKLAMRLALLRDLLAPRGILYVRLDTAAPAYVRSMLDTLFGEAYRIDVSSGEVAGGTPPLRLERNAGWEAWIDAHSSAGAIIADVSGTGALALAAERLGRHWVVCAPAAQGEEVRRRLLDYGTMPFLRQAAGKDRFDALARSAMRSLSADAISRRVLEHYGIPSLPVANPETGTGSVIGGSSPRDEDSTRTLVVVDSPTRRTGSATLKRALTHRGGTRQRWQKILVFGWRFEPDAAECITALNDKRLAVFSIAKHLLNAGDGTDRSLGSAPFAPLHGLTLDAMRCEPVTCSHGGRCYERIVVRLKRYAPLPFAASVANVDMDCNHAEVDPLARLVAWTIDPNYDGKHFHAVWQDYRGSRANGGDPARLATEARLVVPHRGRVRCICVRTIDTEGFESQIVRIVGAQGMWPPETP